MYKELIEHTCREDMEREGDKGVMRLCVGFDETLCLI